MRIIYETDESGRPTGLSRTIEEGEGRPLGWASSSPPSAIADPVWLGGFWASLGPAEDSVPEAVTPAQAKTALYNAGLYDRAEAAVGNSQYALIRIWWNSAQEWKRSDPYIHAIAAELDLDDDAVDDLFRAAGRVAR